ncbi:MAG: hypothetical protein IBJ07_20755 [Rhizobiaceae bacterium]|nr:hypothetical protein [Rhizobiaceae bacterium]
MVEAKELTLLLLANRTEVQLGDMRVDIDVAARLVDLGLVAIDDKTHMIKLTAKGAGKLARWKESADVGRLKGESVIRRAPLPEAGRYDRAGKPASNCSGPKKADRSPYAE